MATNVYYAKEAVYYQGLDSVKGPSEHWGYYIATSYGACIPYLYDSKRELIESEERVRGWLRHQFPVNVPSSYEEDMAVAYILVYTMGVEEDVDFAVAALTPSIPVEVINGEAMHELLGAKDSAEFDKMLSNCGAKKESKT